jgi:hypothetical protein
MQRFKVSADDWHDQVDRDIQREFGSQVSDAVMLIKMLSNWDPDTAANLIARNKCGTDRSEQCAMNSCLLGRGMR